MMSPYIELQYTNEIAILSKAQIAQVEGVVVCCVVFVGLFVGFRRTSGGQSTLH